VVYETIRLIRQTPTLYPTLPHDVADTITSFRLKKICDCQTELQNEISHYKKVLKNIQTNALNILSQHPLSPESEMPFSVSLD